MKAGDYRRLFSSDVCTRGLNYFKQDRVELTECGGNNVSAIVYGTEVYTTSIIFDDNADIKRMSCTCPYYTGWESNCKHLWATILKCEAAEEQSKQSGKHVLSPFSPKKTKFWKSALIKIESAAVAGTKPAAREDVSSYGLPFYLLDIELTIRQGVPSLVLCRMTMKKTGEWGAIRSIHSYETYLFKKTGNYRDFQIVAILNSMRSEMFFEPYAAGYGTFDVFSTARIVDLIPMMLETGRFGFMEKKGSRPVIVSEDTQGAWRLQYFLDGNDDEGYRIHRHFRRGDETIDYEDTNLILDGDPMWCFAGEKCLRVEKEYSFAWVVGFARDAEIVIEKEDLPEFFEIVSRGGSTAPDFQLPDSIDVTEDDSIEPVPELVVEFKDKEVTGSLSFIYETHTIGENDRRSRILNVGDWRYIIRDEKTENAARALLEEVGFGPVGEGAKRRISIQTAFDALEKLVGAGWSVLGREGKPISAHSGFSMNVSSGIDWFDIEGSVSYGDIDIPLLDMIEQYASGDRLVRLDDGTMGLMPAKWLQQNMSLLELGRSGDDTIRYSKAQISLLDTLLDQSPAATFDEKFRAARDKFKKFDKIEPVKLTRAFKGKLREYQKEGLYWLNFLDDFGFGGCLADDMGLGKTVQALALLSLPAVRKKGVSLVVAPTSLVFNWLAEAKRFTPGLKTLSYTGPGRKEKRASLKRYNLVVTTYGIVLRDIKELRKIQFNYAILDESQAIKNPKTKTAKAVRLLKSRNRLVMTGTPLENRLEELWSQFEYINPGLLGTEEFFCSRFINSSKNTAVENSPAPKRELLKKIIKPFLLRRMKDEVELDLPPKNEQTLTSDMTAGQRKTYDRIAAYFRQQIIDSMDKRGLARSKMKVLEGLLRLRQVCCHPALLDEQLNTARARNSGKFNLFREMVLSSISENHKILVFSQFTSMLAIIRKWFDKEKIPYEYLDGRTRKREERVTRFQHDDTCRAFLISLKAGGLGLNLTAADYVFIYDPWWNPAVEAQAVDRTHRIGQDKTVFTYRLIAADSIEEKILELQSRKKKLVESVLAGQSNLFRDLTREDIVNLFS